MTKENENKRRQVSMNLKKKTSDDNDAMGEPQQFVGFDTVEAPPAVAEPKQPKKDSSRKDIDVIVERLAWAKQRQQGFDETIDFSR